MDDYPKTQRNDWVKKWAGQAVLAVSATYWTTYVTEALSAEGPKAMQDYLEINNSQIDDIVALVRLVWIW